MDKKIKSVRVKRMRKYKEFCPGDWNLVKNISESTGEDIDIGECYTKNKFLKMVTFNKKSNPNLSVKICFNPESGRNAAMISEEEVFFRKIRDINLEDICRFLKSDNNK